MAADRKFASLLSGAEGEERIAADELRRVEEVARSRGEVVEVLRKRAQKLRDERERLRRDLRGEALRRGEGRSLGGVAVYERRLARELTGLEKELELREREWATALSRRAAAEEDLVAARIERRKVEQLISVKAQQQRVFASAKEETELDELVTNRRR